MPLTQFIIWMHLCLCSLNTLLVIELIGLVCELCAHSVTAFIEMLGLYMLKLNFDVQLNNKMRQIQRVHEAIH